MIALSAGEVAQACGGRTESDATIIGVTVDSRAVAPGDLFVALPGERTDGARYAAAALEAGAAAVMTAATPGRPPADDRTIAVPDPLIGLGRLAAEVRRRSGARVVGITGSTGKTSTKDLLAALLRRRLRTVASHANLTPRSACR